MKPFVGQRQPVARVVIIKCLLKVKAGVPLNVCMVQLLDCDFLVYDLLSSLRPGFREDGRKIPVLGEKENKGERGRSKFCSVIFPKGKSLYAMRIEIVQL